MNLLRLASPVAATLLAATLALDVNAQPPKARSEDDFARGVALHQKGDFHGASEAYRAVLKRNPGRLDALANLGTACLQMRKFDLAIEQFRQILAIDPKLSSVRQQLAVALFQLNQFEDARRELSLVVSVQSNNHVARQLLGVSLLKLNKLDEGIAELEKAYASQPNDLELAYRLGSAYVRGRRLDRAKKLIEATLGRADTAEAHLIAGSYYNAIEDYAAAVAELTRARELNPRLPTLNLELGYAYLLRREKELALPFFQEELRRSPDDPDANALAGWLLREKGQIDEAEALLRKALHLRPNESGVLFQLAQIAKARGELAKAALLLEKVVEQEPDFTAAHVLLVPIYQKLGRTKEVERERLLIDNLNAEEQKRHSSNRERLRQESGFTLSPQ